MGQTAIGCAASNGNTFDDCVRTAGGEAAWKVHLPEKRPRFGFVSQIREAAYSMDDGLTFVQALQATPVSAPPLELTVQMTIDNDYHWPFPGFEKTGTPIVLGRLAAEKGKELKELQQLAALQRLFRVAFAGGFGPGFPLVKLVELSAVAKEMDKLPSQTTPRWLKDRGDDRTMEHELASDMRGYLSGKDMQGVERLDHAASVRVRSLLTTCSETLGQPNVESMALDSLEARCPWSQMRDEVEAECRTAYKAKKPFSSVEACRVWNLAATGERRVGPIHTLRLALKAAEVDRADALHCPAVPEVRRVGSSEAAALN